MRQNNKKRLLKLLGENWPEIEKHLGPTLQDSNPSSAASSKAAKQIHDEIYALCRVLSFSSKKERG